MPMVEIPPPNHYSHLQSRVQQVRLGGGRVMADGASYPPGPPLTVDGCRMACSIYRATAHAQGTGWRGMRRACAASWHYFAPEFAPVSAYFSYSSGRDTQWQPKSICSVQFSFPPFPPSSLYILYSAISVIFLSLPIRSFHPSLSL